MHWGLMLKKSCYLKRTIRYARVMSIVGTVFCTE